MRRTAARTTALVVGGGALLGIPAPAVAAEVIEVNAQEWTFHYTDIGRRGPSAGDSFVFTEKLFKRGERVGRDAGQCVVKRATRRSVTYQCAATLTFRGRGDLTVMGAVTERRRAPNPVLAVTGGTGDFVGASGEFEITETRGRDHYQIRLI